MYIWNIKISLIIIKGISYGAGVKHKLVIYPFDFIMVLLNWMMSYRVIFFSQCLVIEEGWKWRIRSLFFFSFFFV